MITLFSGIEIMHQSAGIAEIAERIGEFTLVVAGAIICDRRFASRVGLDEIATVKKDSRPMFVIVRYLQCHEGVRGEV